MKRIFCLVIAMLLLLPTFAMFAVGAETYDDAFAVYDFANVEKEDTNLFAERAEWFEEDNGYVKGYQVPLARNTWYLIDATANMAAAYGNLSTYRLRDNAGTDIVVVSAHTYKQFIIYSGNSTMLYAIVDEGEPQPAASQVTMNKLKSFDMDFDIMKTSFEWDVKNMFPSIDLTKHSKDSYSEDFFEILTMYEDFEKKELYIYIFNPSGKAITGGTFEMIDGSTANMIPCGRTVSTEYYRAPHFIKFRVRNWGYRNPVTDGVSDTTTRRYDMGDVTFAYSDGTSKTFENDAIFTMRDGGAATQTLALSTAGEEKTVQVERDSKIKIDIGYTWYRTDTSPEGAYYHNQVDSIYFNIPNQLLRDYGELTNVVIEYNQVRTKPIIVTDEYGIYANYLRPYTMGDASVFEDAKSLWLLRQGQNGNPVFNEYAYPLTDAFLSLFFGTFYVQDVNAGFEQPRSTVYYETLEEWMNAYPTSGETVTGANGEIDADLFETINRNVVVQTGDLELSADSYASGHNFFQEWLEYGWNYMHDDEAEDDNLDLSEKIVRITSQRQLKVEGADGLYYNYADQNKLLNCFSQGQQSDSSMYLVRFNVSQYYSRPLAWQWGSADPVTGRMYEAQQDMYLDLNVIGLDFTSDSGQVTMVDVESNHIDCGGDVTPEKNPEDINQESADKGFGTFEDTVGEFLKTLGILLGIVALVVLVAVFGPVIAPFLSKVFQAIGKFFKKIAAKWKAFFADIKKKAAQRKKQKKQRQKKPKQKEK